MVKNQTAQYELLNKKKDVSRLGIFQYIRVILQYPPLDHALGKFRIWWAIGECRIGPCYGGSAMEHSSKKFVYLASCYYVFVCLCRCFCV